MFFFGRWNQDSNMFTRENMSQIGSMGISSIVVGSVHLYSIASHSPPIDNRLKLVGELGRCTFRFGRLEESKFKLGYFKW